MGGAAMKRIIVVGAGVLLLLLGATSPIYAGQQDQNQQQDKGKQQDQNKGQQQQRSQPPVSYTHLTLPTILRV